MSITINTRRNKHVILTQAKLKKAQQVLGAKTETETIERALDSVISEAARNRQAWAAHDKFIRAVVRDNLMIEDVFGRLKGK